MIKYDTIIIGGGLSGLTCGIRLAEKGLKCAIISAGQNALSNGSGAFNLLNNLPDGTSVVNPIEAIDSLSEDHPYSKIGAQNCLAYANEAKEILKRAGIEMIGKPTENHKRLTPMGSLKNCWLSIDEHHIAFCNDTLPWKKVAIMSFVGFMDFNPTFLANGLEKTGIKCLICKISLPAIHTLRKNASEMRASNIARIFNDKSNIEETARAINAQDCEAVLLPSVFGLKDNQTFNQLKALVNKPVCLVPTLPPSVPGIRITEQLSARFRALGGTIFQGDSVVNATFEQDTISRIFTANHTETPFVAKNFVLCAGDFYSQGLTALSDKVYEPVFQADVNFTGDCTTWCEQDFFAKQPYQYFGVITDKNFHVQKEGKTISNLYAGGAILSSFNALKEGSGAGVAMLSAIAISNAILNTNQQ